DWGGRPSPVLPDGRMFSLPIPDRGSPIRYSDIKTPWDESALSLMRRMGIQRVRHPGPDGLEVIPIDHNPGAHLDPDLRREAIRRRSGWRPLFGQVSTAQAHLENEAVGPGDLF